MMNFDDSLFIFTVDAQVYVKSRGLYFNLIFDIFEWVARILTFYFFKWLKTFVLFTKTDEIIRLHLRLIN